MSQSCWMDIAIDQWSTSRVSYSYAHHVTAATPPRAHGLRQLPSRSVVRAAAESAVLLPGDARGSAFKREPGGAGRGL